MPIKFHRCSVMINRIPAHPCWKVQKALDAAGVDYEIVKEPALRPRRKWTIEKTGEHWLPVLELEDGTIIREDSSELVERIRSGNLQPAATAEAVPR
jgi:glutathione S-transferase